MEELERILASEEFRNSKQAERLLRYLVANSLEEHDEQLRERIIGEKIFGRRPKYDSKCGFHYPRLGYPFCGNAWLRIIRRTARILRAICPENGELPYFE